MGQAFRQDVDSGDLEFGLQSDKFTWDEGAETLYAENILLPNTGLHLLDTDASHDLILKPGSDLTADRTLTITTGDADRTLTLGGDASLDGTEVKAASAFGTDNVVLRADGTGRGSQASGVFITDTNQLVIGSASPDATLAAIGDALHVVAESGAALFVPTGFGVTPAFFAIRGNGTQSSPTVVLNGQSLFQLSGSGYDDTSPGDTAIGASVNFDATENWTPTTTGTKIIWRATATGATGHAARMTLQEGLQMGAPTGGDKGVGTINVATDIYKNNTAYTNPDYVFERHFTGQITLHTPREIEMREEVTGRNGEFVMQTRMVPNPSQIQSWDYDGLMDLDELEKFCNRHHCLPRISRARGMFERSDAVLEKLEELHLYIFDLHKRIRRLEGR